MPTIHPSAIVDPKAELANDVEVGPSVIIEAGAQIGARSRILANAVIKGCVRMGADNEVGYGAVIGAAPQDLSFKKETKSYVSLGEGNTIREYVTIHRGAVAESQTIVGDHNYLMVGVHLGHNVHLHNKIVITNNCLLAGYVEVQDRVVLGGGSVFHQFIKVGTLAMVRGGSRISKNIPPYLMAYESNLVSGLNVVGLRRAGMSIESRMELKRAFRLIYRTGLNVTEALRAARQDRWSGEVLAFFDFIEQSSKRGICKVTTKGNVFLKEEE
ncbi:MAG: acyl-ACP--UDP-N-acetylglucosamine O-acyltransferase [Verrucomicrobia bacterium]|nr:acyl-ACP--UDP-N-acetylglucosamine O-acyltransferase [Verrucomicrobiota bacterium]